VEDQKIPQVIAVFSYSTYNEPMNEGEPPTKKIPEEIETLWETTQDVVNGLHRILDNSEKVVDNRALFNRAQKIAQDWVRKNINTQEAIDRTNIIIAQMKELALEVGVLEEELTTANLQHYAQFKDILGNKNED
jgi:hypothetical protein